MEKKMNARKKAQRAARLRKQRNRRIALTLCLMFVVAFASIGGTIAWLTANSGPVVNTFTASNINIELTETLPANKTAKMVPGSTIKKDPAAKVLSGSEACYLFVKIDESTNAKFSDYMSYVIADGWEPVDGKTGVYFRTVTTDQIGIAYPILKDNQVTVKDTVTKAMMTALTEETNPTLTFTAYAIQSANLDVTVTRTIANIYEMAVAGTTTA